MFFKRLFAVIILLFAACSVAATGLEEKGGVGYDRFGSIGGFSVQYWFSERIGVQGIFGLDSYSFKETTSSDETEYSACVDFQYELSRFKKGRFTLGAGLGVISINKEGSTTSVKEIGFELSTEYFICSHISFNAGTGFLIQVEPDYTRLLIGTGDLLGTIGFHYYF